MNGGGAALQAQSLVHTSVFSPPPALHPYQDLALGWQQSSKLLDHCQGVSTELVQAWDQQSVASFITSVTGSQRCGAVFQERVRIAALMPSACRHNCQVLQGTHDTSNTELAVCIYMYILPTCTCMYIICVYLYVKNCVC